MLCAIESPVVCTTMANVDAYFENSLEDVAYNIEDDVTTTRERAIHDVANRLRKIGDDIDRRYSGQNLDFTEVLKNYFRDFVLLELRRKVQAVSMLLNRR